MNSCKKLYKSSYGGEANNLLIIISKGGRASYLSCGHLIRSISEDYLMSSVIKEVLFKRVL